MPPKAPCHACDRLSCRKAAARRATDSIYGWPKCNSNSCLSFSGGEKSQKSLRNYRLGQNSRDDCIVGAGNGLAITWAAGSRRLIRIPSAGRPHGPLAAFRPLGNGPGLVIEQHLQFEITDRGFRAGALRDRRPPSRVVSGLGRPPASARCRDRRTRFRPRSGDSACAQVAGSRASGDCRTRLGEDRVPVGARRRAKGDEFDDHTRLDLLHARHRLDGARDLRRDLVAAGQLHLDVGVLVEHQHQDDLGIALSRSSALGDALDRPVGAQQHAQAFLSLLRRPIERLDGLDARAHVVALRFGGEEQQHRRARFEQVAVLRQAFLEDHRLVVAGRIGEFQDAHLVAGLGAPLGARHHGAGDAARGRALLHRIGERRPRLHVQPLQRRRVIVERVAGEEEADRVELALQPLGRQPRLRGRQRDLLARRRAAEHVVLADRRGLVLALRGRENRIDARMDARAVALQRIERAGGGKAFQHALVDRARVHAAREVGDVAERLVAARLDDRLDRLAARRPSARRAHSGSCCPRPRNLRRSG